MHCITWSIIYVSLYDTIRYDILSALKTDGRASLI